MNYSYSEYERLLKDKDFSAFIHIIDAVSKKTGIAYAVSGGVASYLYSKNPPTDYPDIDVIVDADAAGGGVFLKHILQDRRIRETFYCVAGTDIISTLIFDDSVSIDFVTMQAHRAYIFPSHRHSSGVSLEPIESLIVGKICRGYIGDFLMAFDMLITDRFNAARLMCIARTMNAEYVMSMVLKTVSDYKRGRINELFLKNYARHLSKMYGAGKYVTVKHCECGYLSNESVDWKAHRKECTGEPLYVQLRRKSDAEKMATQHGG